MLNYLKKQGVVFYLGIVLIVANLATIIYLFTQLSSHAIEYPLAIVFLAVGIVLEAFLLFIFPNKSFTDAFLFGAAVLTALGYALFMCRGVMNIFDWVAKVTYWGNPKQAINTFVFCAVGVVSILCSVIASFIHDGGKAKA